MACPIFAWLVAGKRPALGSVPGAADAEAACYVHAQSTWDAVHVREANQKVEETSLLADVTVAEHVMRASKHFCDAQVREANQMVEEMMLLANVTVAEHVLRAFSGCALLRRHPTPPPRQFEPLLRAAAAAHVDIDISSSKVTHHTCGSA